jgi:DNA-binding transcriptional LysR family regulator
MIDWDDLRIFGAVADAGSLAGAGRRLGLNHSTVGRRVAALEASVGSPLIVRLARSTVLTPTGVALAHLAHEMSNIAQQAQFEARSSRDQIVGEVTISVPPLLASRIVTPALAEIHRAHPALRYTVIGSQGIAALDRGEADIAIRLTEPVGGNVVMRRLGILGFALYAAPNVAILPPEQWGFIGYDKALEVVPQHKWLLDYAGNRPIVFRTNDVHAMAAAVAAGFGVAALPLLIGESSTGIVQVDAPNAPAPRTVSLVIHADLRRAPAVRLVVDRLVEALGQALRSEPNQPAG